jgi:hypothetical protein
VTDDAYADHLARRQAAPREVAAGPFGPAEPDERPQNQADEVAAGPNVPGARPPAGFEYAIDPHDAYANGGEQPWDPDSPPVRKLRRIGAGTVRAAAHGLGEWNPYTGRFE